MTVTYRVFHLTVVYSLAFQTVPLDFYLHEPAVQTPEQFRAIPYRRPLPYPQVLYASHLYDFCHILIWFFSQVQILENKSWFEFDPMSVFLKDLNKPLPHSCFLRTDHISIYRTFFFMCYVSMAPVRWVVHMHNLCSLLCPPYSSIP